MNLKTTIALLVLVGAAGAGGYYWHYQRTPPTVESASAKFFDADLNADGLTRIEIRRGPRSLVLERASAKEEWSLPGKWPTRDKEVEQLVSTIADMRSRFAPYSLEEKKAIFDKEPLTLKLRLGGTDHVLTLAEATDAKPKPDAAEEADTADRFSRPTYVRLDENNEVLRLAPGLVAALDHDEEYFRTRRIFPRERVAKDNSAEKVNQLLASAVVVTRAKQPDFASPFEKLDKSADEAKDGPRYRLIKAGDSWEMAEPIRDRLDPEKLKVLLTGLAGVWVENFVDRRGRSLAELGLEKPYLTVAVTRPSGTNLELQLGEVSKLDFRKEMKPAQPDPFGGPGQPRIEMIKTEYRYAKLSDNDLIFEVKTDALDDQLPRDARMLRDQVLAHFKADDARRLEIHAKGNSLFFVTLVKSGPEGKEVWKLQGGGYDAEDSVVSELLAKLADLKTKDFIDKADPKSYGLDNPAAVVKVTVKEKADKEDKDSPPDKDAKDNKESKQLKEITHIFHLGVSDKEKSKLFIQTPGWPRINVLDDAVLKLVERPAIAYRARKLIDVPLAQLETIQLRHGGDAFSLEQIGSTWRLNTPVRADVDASKVNDLARALVKLDAVEFITDQPKNEDLDKVYGLAAPRLTATLHFKDAKIQSLYVGNAHGKDDFYARIDQGPIFVIRKDLRDLLMKDDLAYRSEKPWDLKADAITEVAIRKNDQELHLKRTGDAWKIVAPFSADAIGFYGEKLAKELSGLKVLSYVPRPDKNQANYGLDKPYLSVKVLSSAGEQTLVIGKELDAGRAAIIAGKGELFILENSVVAGLDLSAFDLLDRKVLTIDLGQIVKCGVKGQPAFTLEQKKDGWHVIDSPAPPFLAEEEAAHNYLQAWANLRADKIVAYGPKIDWAVYGLDKPAAVYTVVLKADNKDGKPTEHALYLGKDAAAPNERGDRYARIDQKPEVIVLNGFLVKMLAKSHLDFVSPLVLKFARDSVAGLSRQMPGGDFAVEKKGDTWSLLKPDRPADTATIEKILDDFYRLRGQSVAGYPVQEANLAQFGLDKPAAVINVKLADDLGKTSEHIIRIGKQADGLPSPSPKKNAGHYAIVDKGNTVVVLAPELSRLLLSSALNFGDRNLVNTAGVDQVILRHGLRKAVFLQESGEWTMVDPIRSEAETEELTNLVRGLSRLRADEMIAEKADPKLFDLDRPHIECKLLAQGKIVLDLAVGSAEPGDEKTRRLYAKLAGKDVVFLLSPAISAKIQEEFRNRKPWQPFDVAQVAKLSFEGPGKTFALFKQGPGWLVLDKFDLKVDAKLVIDTLDTLARLKALRYVEDAKANLQQYGLTPPALKVEVESPAGKRTLLIGAPEGSSQRRYASVAGGDSVFVIDVADLQKIMRGLGAYTGVQDKK